MEESQGKPAQCGRGDCRLITGLERESYKYKAKESELLFTVFLI